MSISFNKDAFLNHQGKLQVLLVIKETRFELYQKNKKNFKTNRNTADLIDMQEGYRIHQESLRHVCDILQKNQVDFWQYSRSDFKPQDIQNRIVITIGGDGTLLDAAHYIEENPILGVNSDPTRSVGSLCVATKETFEGVFNQLLQGKLPIKKVIRIEGYLDNKKLPVEALNEVLIAHENPAAMSRYTISLNNKNELQKSSGVWVAAPLGSSGAVVSAGGKVQEVDDDRIQIIVREPYFSSKEVPQFLFVFVRQPGKITFISQMQDGYIYFDGPSKKFHFGLNSRLTLAVSPNRLNLFLTPEMEDRRQKIGRFRENYQHHRISLQEQAIF